MKKVKNGEKMGFVSRCGKELPKWKNFKKGIKKAMKRRMFKSLTAWVLAASILAPNISLAGEWHSQGNNWYYQDSGVNQTGWINDAEHWYYLKQDGVMSTGWQQDEKHDWYYLNTAAEGTEGSMRTGWFLKDGKWYFLNTAHDGFYGRVITGKWQWIDGYCYLFDENGMMYADCVTPDGYTVNADGRWTVNGVVQYVPGKGIITKQEVRTGGGTRRSGGGSSSGGNHGGSGDNSGDTGNQKEKTKITVLYKERESDKVLDTVSYEGTEGDKITLEWRQFTGYTLCAGQPQEAVFGKEDSTVTIYYLKNSDSGKIIVQCVEKESGKLLAQKEVVGEVGERYVVQYPAYSGYKLLDEEQKVLVFEKEPQTVIINYRVKLDNEDPDQRIVLADNLKAISPNTSEQNKIVNQIYDQIFDYNVDENGNAELAVMNDNPLLQYIYDGTYKENDIIYIDMCDAFPTGFIMTYYRHDDNYSGEYDDEYNAATCEVIHGKKVEFFELFQEGTYIDYNLSAEKNEIQLEKVFEWSVDDGEDEQSSNVSVAQSRSQAKPLFDIELSDPASIEISYSHKFKYKEDSQENTGNDSSQADSNNNGNQESAANRSNQNNPDNDNNQSNDDNDNNQNNTNNDNNQDNTNNGNTSIPTEASIAVVASGIAKVNSVNISVGNPLNGFEGTSFYADFTESFDIGLTANCKGNIGDFVFEKLLNYKKRENVLKLKLWGINVDVKGVDISNSYIVHVVGYTPGTGISMNVDVDSIFSTPNEYGTTDLTIKPVIFAPIMLDLEALGEANFNVSGHLDLHQEIGTGVDEHGKPNEQENPEPEFIVEGSLSLNADLYAGGATGLGIAMFGITPVMLKATVLAVDANANGEIDFTIYPKFKVQPKGSISFDLLTQLDLMLNLAGEVNKDLNIDISGNWEIFNKVWLHLQYPKQPKTITLSKNTSVNATNNIGWDISQQFTGYDSESKTLKPKTVTDGYTFQCPAYIKDKDEYFSVTKLEAKEKECVGLDLSKAENLEEIVLDSVSIKQLDVSANKKLKTVSIDNCRTLETFTGNGIAFPTQLTWYKDKEKTQQVKSAKDFAAGETIYSENYGLKPVTMKDYQLSLNEDTAVIAVDQFGRNISSDYEGHENGWVKVVKNGDNFSFDCPQYIKIAEDGWCFQVTEINTSESVRCEKLDLSRAPKIHTVSLYNNELHTLEVAPDNVITSLSVGIFDEASTSKTLWDLDFSEMPLLTKLSLANRSLKNGLNLSQHKNLKELLLRNVEFSSLNLPENASLKNLKLSRCNGISRLDLSKQISLELLTVNYCENIALVDVSSCPNCQWGDNYVPAVMFTKFRGNGQMFPYGDWYADENFTEKVTKNTYDGHSLIYRKTNDEQAKKSFEKIKPSMLDDAEKEENEDLNSSDKNTATSSNAKKKN